MTQKQSSTSRTSSRDLLLAELVALDHRIDAAEDQGIRARWEFGHRMLQRRRGKLLEKGLLSDAAEAIGKQRAEVSRRMLFAQRFPTGDALDHAVIKYGSWHRIVAEGLGSIHFSSETHTWTTPRILFDVLDAELAFDVDVCAADATTALCDRFFTPDDDGLSRQWEGSCWMNPPYGSQIGRWVEKAYESQDSTVTCLLPARVDTSWWWDFCRFGEIRFLRGRLKFGDAPSGAPFPSAVVLFPRKPKVVWWEWEA